MPYSILDPVLTVALIVAVALTFDALWTQAKRQETREREARELAMIARRYESRGGEMPAPER